MGEKDKRIVVAGELHSRYHISHPSWSSVLKVGEALNSELNEVRGK